MGKSVVFNYVLTTYWYNTIIIIDGVVSSTVIMRITQYGNCLKEISCGGEMFQRVDVYIMGMDMMRYNTCCG